MPICSTHLVSSLADTNTVMHTRSIQILYWHICWSHSLWSTSSVGEGACATADRQSLPFAIFTSSIAISLTYPAPRTASIITCTKISHRIFKIFNFQGNTYTAHVEFILDYKATTHYSDDDLSKKFSPHIQVNVEHIIIYRSVFLIWRCQFERFSSVGC